MARVQTFINVIAYESDFRSSVRFEPEFRSVSDWPQGCCPGASARTCCETRQQLSAVTVVGAGSLLVR